MVMHREWAVLVYKISPHPTRLRALVWRRLQRCGAIYRPITFDALYARASGKE
jgi:hypothetical protein